MVDKDARRLAYRQFTQNVPSGTWRRVVIHDDSRVRLRISGTIPFQLSIRPDAGSIFAFVESGSNNTYDLRRDLDGDIVANEIWFISFATTPAYFGYEVVDPHGLYNVNVE